MLCKNLRSPFKNNALCCFFTAFESPNIVLCKTKNSPCWVSSLFWRRMGDSNPRARKGKRFSSFSLHLPMPPNRSFWAPFGHKKGIITAVLCAFVVQCARIRARTRENNRFLFSSQKVRELLFDKPHFL